MLDHILGKPSANVRRIQVLATLLATMMLVRRRRAPWGLRWLARVDSSKVSMWKATLGWTTALYLFRHMDDLLGLNAPEPLREYYSRSFYRATWIFTALDAGFWTAMSVRPKILRDMLSLLFTLYYLVYTDRGIEKVRKVRALITIDHLRVSWNKGADNPVLRLVRWMHSSRLTVHRKVTVALDGASGLEPVACHVMYAGDPTAFATCRRVVLNYPGGGFVCMGPESHSDYLSAWAAKTQAVVVSVDYAKAPEYPYPYAIDQCYELYRVLVRTNGKCIGLQAGRQLAPLRVVMAGDSAGGNITASVMFRILEAPDRLPHPQGIVFIYGNFNMDIRAWMTTDETRALLEAPANVPLDCRASHESLTSLVGTRDHMHHVSPLAVTNSDDGYRRQLGSRRRRGRPVYLDARVRVSRKQQPEPAEPTEPAGQQQPLLPSVGYVPLAMTSSFTYFNDRILSPEMMRAMIIMYIGPNRRPDFRTDYYLSPRVAPDRLLERFPPVYFMCGEKDPMVDDTVLFAARIRQAKQRRAQRRPESAAQFYIGSTDVSEDEDNAHYANGGGQQLPQSLRMSGMPPQHQSARRHYHNVVKVKLVAGMSHGFMQMYALLPESKRVANLLGDWLGELLDGNWKEEDGEEGEAGQGNAKGGGGPVAVAARYGLEEVSTADMVHRRGHGLADPLS